MKKVLSKVAAVWRKAPKTVKSETAHVVLTFAVAFVAVAAPAVPALVKNVEGGQLPDLSVVKALVVAAVAAGVKAAIPTVRAAVVHLVTSGYGWVKASKDARLQKAVEAYLALKAAEEAAKVGQAQRHEVVA